MARDAVADGMTDCFDFAQKPASRPSDNSIMEPEPKGECCLTASTENGLEMPKCPSSAVVCGRMLVRINGRSSVATHGEQLVRGAREGIRASLPEYGIRQR
jgi:hypothetical protein